MEEEEQEQDTLAPVADALSATFAVIVLLTCFFILAQLVAITNQIQVKHVGASKYINNQINIDFKEIIINKDKLEFTKSFSPEKNKAIINQYIDKVIASSGECTKYKVISNYPITGVSKERSIRRALTNGIKVIPFLKKRGLDYELEVSNKYNYYFIEISKIKQKKLKIKN